MLEQRRHLKPTISNVGIGGIPIRHALELELRLRAPERRGLALPRTKRTSPTG
jgi:hypothetical protein